MKFKKMHGLGNDFIIVDCRERIPDRPEEMSIEICSRHTGVGADGLILVTHSDKAEIGMRIFNSDGSQAEMCGNGIRCFAKYVYEEGIIRNTGFTVDTLAGIMRPELVLGNGGSVKSVIVDMGIPVLDPQNIPVITDSEIFLDVPVEVDGENLSLSTIGMGVPHTVIYVDGTEKVDIEKQGKAVENHQLFPYKTNVNFVRVNNRKSIEVRTWERGAGKTLACGTGCCSAVVVSSLLDKTDREVEVELPLGNLKINWSYNGRVYMEGPAENICTGTWLK